VAVRGQAIAWSVRLLTWKRARNYSLAIGFLYIFAWGYVSFTGDLPLNRSRQPLGGDFMAFYTAGRLVLSGDGAQLYDKDRVIALQESILGGRAPGFYDAFRNPPFFAVPFAPLALLDLLPSLALYSALSMACLVAAVWLLLDTLPAVRRRWRGLAAVIFAFGPVYFGLIDGENATLSLLLYVLIYRSLRRGDDRAAGVWAALGLFKPQLFVVFPLIFVASRRWPALWSYVAVSLCLALVSVAVVGPQGVQAWVRTLVDSEGGNATANAWRMHSIKSFLDLLLPGMPLFSIGLFTISAGVLLVLLCRAWADHGHSVVALWPLTSLVAVLVDPHLVDYDLTVLVPAGVLAAIYLPRVRVWIALLYPLLVFRAQLPLGDASVQFSTLVLVVCLGLVWADTQPVFPWHLWRHASARRATSP
jgi:alpha-1,2-mannosyltransferase